MKKQLHRILSFALVAILACSCINLCITIDVHADQVFYWPLDTNHNITTGFYGYTNHNGCDMACASGTPIYALFDGTANYYQKYTFINGVKTLTSYGNCVYLNSDDQTYQAIYAHMNAFEGFSLEIPSSNTKKQSGSTGTITIGSKRVSEGDVIGYVGQTGNATGNHLHLGLKINGSFVNPESYLSNSMSANEHGYHEPQNPPTWTNVGMEKYVYQVGETATFNFWSDTAIGYVIGIDDAYGNRIDTTDLKQSSYSRSFSAAGNYSCYITAYNSAGGIDSERINFIIYDRAPEVSKITMSKYTFRTGEDVTFSIVSDMATGFSIGIDDENGNRIETHDMHDWQYTRHFDEPGNYSCYVTSYNSCGYLDSERVSFTVYNDKPQRSNVSMSRYALQVGENAIFYFSSDKANGYTIGIDDSNGNRIDTFDTKEWSYVRAFDTPGYYSCYVTSYNEFGYIDSERISFVVYKDVPEKSKITMSKYQLQVGEEVRFEFTSDTAFGYVIGIDDVDGNRIDTYDTKDWWYTRSFSNAGNYSCYVTCYNAYGGKDSERVYFTVYDKTCTITYDMNGGTGTIASQTKTYGNDLTLSSTKPTRTGYTFLGWNNDKQATTAQYQPGGKYTANTSTTLYAIWKEYEYELSSWTWNGTSSAIASFTCKDDSSQNKTVNATITSTTTAATCEKAGKTVYTATATFEGKNYTDTKEVLISATGHSYKLTGWNWNGYDFAKATFTCENDSVHKKTIDAEITRDTTDGSKIVYTAALTFEGKEYSDTKTEFITHIDSDILITSDTDTGKDQSSDVEELSDTEKESDTNDNSESDEDLHDDSDTEQDSDEPVEPESNTDSDSHITSDSDSESDSDNNSNSDDDSNQAIPGDINGDGKVNMKDVTRLHQYINGWDVFVNEEVLDINGDGKVNMKDLTRLHQYINGWNVTLNDGS